MMFHSLSIDAFEAPSSPFDPGPAPYLTWLPIANLVVDTTYQRDIGKRGAQNIKRIATTFDWAKFAPVIVAPIEGELFAIVDGQHRCTAAMLRNVAKVPCQIVQADRSKQAAAFAAVNGSVTKTTIQQIHYARIAAGDPATLELERVFSAGGVRVPRRNLSRGKTRVGDTQAVGALRRCQEKFGSDTLITALQCVTQTGDGNAGWLRSNVIEALCETLDRTPAWLNSGSRLLEAMDTFDFEASWDEAVGTREIGACIAAKEAFKAIVTKHLDQKLGRPQLAAA